MKQSKSEFELKDNYDFSKGVRGKFYRVENKHSLEVEEALKAMEEISKNRNFDLMVQVAQEKGLSIKEVLKDMFEQFVNREIDIKTTH